MSTKQLASLQQIVFYTAQAKVVFTTKKLGALLCVIVLLFAIAAQRQLLQVRQNVWIQHLKCKNINIYKSVSMKIIGIRIN
jgi:uncharacterized membrane protein YidH (DUF202 family)